MAQELPVDIIREIERRWQRRLDAQPKPGKNEDRDVAYCPLCNAVSSIRPLVSGAVVSRPDYVCGSCGHAWADEARQR